MNITQELITPEKAKQYLESNTHNRALRKALVEIYAKDIANGRWRATHQGIAFSSDGRLLDGQHRLAAIVQAMVPVQMLVARGLPPQSQIVMDDHAKRSAGDALSLALGDDVSARDIAVMRAVKEMGPGPSRHTARRSTKQELMETWELFRNAIQFIRDHFPSAEKGVTAAVVKAAIVLWWFHVEDLERLALFCEIVRGETLPNGIEDGSAVMLREWLLKNGMQSNAIRADGFRKSQRAIQAFMRYEALARLHGTTPVYTWPITNPVRI